MKKSIVALAVLFSAGCGILRAEVIKGPAGLRLKDSGKDAVSLNDGVEVECVDSSAPWKIVGFTAFVDAAFLEQSGSRIKKSAALYDKAGKMLGRVTENLVLEISAGKPDPKTGRAEADIVLLANYHDIKQDSIIEIALARELKAAMGAPAPAGLAGHMKKFGYKKWSGYEGVESFGVYENWMEDPSPGFRMLLIFQRGRLAAVMHSRKISHKFAAAGNFSRGYTLSYLRKLPEAESRKLEKFYLDIINRAD